MIEDFAKGHLHDQLRWVAAEYERQIDTAAREAYWAKVERAAQEAAGGSPYADLADTHGAVRVAP